MRLFAAYQETLNVHILQSVLGNGHGTIACERFGFVNELSDLVLETLVALGIERVHLEKDLARPGNGILLFP